MGILDLLLTAIGLSMDAFAVSICKGLTLRTFKWKQALLVGAYFGIFQMLMPLIGYFFGTLFADRIIQVDHWIAFALLVLIGGKMIYESFDRDHCDEEEPAEKALRFTAMLTLAIATSIDALAIGVTFSFLSVNILPAVLMIGATTFVLSAAGVKIGTVFGRKFKSQAELAGGIILVLMGAKILLEHLGIL